MKYTGKKHTFAVCAYKENKFLEECIKSVLNQSEKSRVFISTSTPNDFIRGVAEKYELPLYVNEGEAGIGGDWNFAYSKAETPLVTIAHQDDIYEEDYVGQMLSHLEGVNDPIIYFCGYGELRNGNKVYDNKILRFKRLMLCPLKNKLFWKSKFIRRRILSLGNPICCPAVTYVKEKAGERPFTNNFLSNIDWEQWEILSRLKGAFVYNEDSLMCHRIYEESTTSEIIGDNLRTDEDYRMYLRFWPGFIAKLLVRFYAKSQNSNNL